jgi:hypothetical protein
MDTVTGQTPRKKRIVVPQSWNLSAKHEDILKAIREKKLLFDEGITTSTATTTASTITSDQGGCLDRSEIMMDVIKANSNLFFIETNVSTEVDHSSQTKESKLPTRSHIKRPHHEVME